MSRTFVTAVLAAALSLSSCATVEGWFEDGSGFQLVSQQALAITGVQPRIESSAIGLADRIEAALDDPAAASLQLGDELDLLLGRFDSGADEIGSKRNRLKTLANRMQENWTTYAVLLPEGHPWKDPTSATDEMQRITGLLNEADSQLAGTQAAMDGVVAQLKPAVSALRKAAGKGQIEAQRELLEAGLDGLREIPDRFAADADLLRMIADEFVFD